MTDQEIRDEFAKLRAEHHKTVARIERLGEALVSRPSDAKEKFVKALAGIVNWHLAPGLCHVPDDKEEFVRWFLGAASYMGAEVPGYTSGRWG